MTVDSLRNALVGGDVRVFTDEAEHPQWLSRDEGTLALL